MIGFLDGVIKTKSANSVILLTTGGVGYKIFLPARVLDGVALNSSQSFFIHTHVREDQISLFGFPNEQDLSVFELLITVSGVGPKTAMNIFSVGNGDQISSAISQKNKLFFKGVSGLGSKTIEKIFLELFNKVGVDHGQPLQNEYTSTNLEEAASALSNLGYQQRDIFDFFRKNQGMEKEKVEVVIKRFLKKD